MDDAEQLKLAKQVVTEEVERAGGQVVRILLFGSRARHDADADSDWDLLVVTDKDLDPSLRHRLCGRISMRLARMGVDCDILIYSQQTVAAHEKDVGHIAYYAMKEGLPI